MTPDRPERPARPGALAPLDVLVGTWTVTADLPGVRPGGPSGRATFGWELDGRVLVQRTQVPVVGVPDSLALVLVDPMTGGLVQHYYDARGVARRYRTTFDGDEWRLLRTEADFSPLDFCQRFVGRLDAGRSVLSGAWEMSDDGVTWRHDFDLTYRRVSDDVR